MPATEWDPRVVDPRKVPYYLLLLGSPGQVPFDVQYQLGVSYAVGRLDLEDPEPMLRTLHPSWHPIGLEARPRMPPRTHRLHFFATRHPGTHRRP